MDRNKPSLTRAIALATLVSGSLDLLFAITLTIMLGRNVGDMLRFVASGPLPAAKDMGTAGAALGALVHFGLMATMAAIFMIIMRWRPDRLRTPLLTGFAWGIVTYFAMNWIVVPLRFGTPLPPKTLSIATQAFAHICLVGIPMALIATRAFGVRSG